MRLFLSFVMILSIVSSNATVRFFDVSSVNVNEHPDYPSNERSLQYNWWDTVIFTNLQPDTEYQFNIFAYDSEDSREKQLERDQSKIYSVLSKIQVNNRDSNYKEFVSIDAKGARVKFKTHPGKNHKNNLSISFRMVNLSRNTRYLSTESN